MRIYTIVEIERVLEKIDMPQAFHNNPEIQEGFDNCKKVLKDYFNGIYHI